MCVVEWWRSGVQSWRLCVETFQGRDDRDRTATRSQIAAVNTWWCTAGPGTTIHRVSYWLANYNQHWVMYCCTRYNDTSCVIITGKLQSTLGNTGSCTAGRGTTIRRASCWLANYNQHWVMYCCTDWQTTINTGSCTAVLTGKLQSTLGHVLLDEVRRYVVCHADWQTTINTGSFTAGRGTTIRHVSYWLANYNQPSSLQHRVTNYYYILSVVVWHWSNSIEDINEWVSRCFMSLLMGTVFPGNQLQWCWQNKIKIS